jgi:hypothetical protein
MAISRLQHHPMLAEGHRLSIQIARNVPDSENRHFSPWITQGQYAFFAPKLSIAPSVTMLG